MDKVHVRAWSMEKDQAAFPAVPCCEFHVFGWDRAREEARRLIDADGMAVVHLVGVPYGFERIT